MIAPSAMLSGMRRAIVLLAAVALVRSLPVLKANSDVYRPQALEWAAFVVLLGVAVVASTAILRRRDLGRRRWVLMVLVLMTSVAATAAVPDDRLITPVHWSWFVIGWFMLAILFGQPPSVIGGVLGLHLAIVIGQVALNGQLDRERIAQIAMRGILFTGGQLAFSIGTQAAQRAEVSAARAAVRRAERQTAARITDELAADRHARHADIALTTEPLLRGLSTGELSADDPAVRRRCLVEAGRLRRLLAEGDLARDPLHHELLACIDVAERAGVRVDVAYRGEWPTPDVAVRRQLTEPVIAALAGARTFARLTVVGAAGEVALSVLTDTATDITTDIDTRERTEMTARHDVQVSIVRSSDRVWVTSQWQAEAREPV